MLYAVMEDESCCALVVVFGTIEDIAVGMLGEGAQDAWREIETLGVELQDSGELCEDYLIASERFTEESQTPELKAIVEAHGFTENPDLLNCSWG